MSTKVITRSTADRIRYSISFELLLNVLFVAIGSLFFDAGLLKLGALGLVLSAIAMVMAFVYNLAFDTFDAKAGRVSSERTPKWRILHAVGFETSLIIVSLPLLIFWLDLSFKTALLADIAFAAMVVVYTYLFTLCYDRIFPLPHAPATA